MIALLGGSCRSSDDDGILARPAPSPTSLTTTTSSRPRVPTTPVETTTTSTTLPAATGVVLGPEGLGAVRFGDDAEQVVRALSRVLGNPSDDGPIRSCPTGEVERLVEYAELTVLFGEREGASRLVAWDLGPPSGALPPLTTPEGVGVGSSVAELRSAYGDRLEIARSDPFGPAFEVVVPAPGRLGGTLTAAGPTATVATLSGGAATCAE